MWAVTPGKNTTFSDFHLCRYLWREFRNSRKRYLGRSSRGRRRVESDPKSTNTGPECRKWFCEIFLVSGIFHGCDCVPEKYRVSNLQNLSTPVAIWCGARPAVSNIFSPRFVQLECLNGRSNPVFQLPFELRAPVPDIRYHQKLISFKNPNSVGKCARTLVYVSKIMEKYVEQ